MTTLRFACRRLGRSPGFAIAVIVCLALGIGANLAIFTLADAVLLRRIGVHDPTRLVRLSTMGIDGRPGGVLGSAVDAIEQSDIFESVCGFLAPRGTVAINDWVGPVSMHAFTGTCFETLGVTPVLGRILSTDDDRAGAPPVVVLSHDAWMQYFGGDSSVIDATVNIEGRTFTIAGVAEPGFGGLLVGFPARLFYAFSDYTDLGAGIPPRSVLAMEVFARLKPGVTAEAAASGLQAMWPRVREASVPSQYVGAQRERYLQRRLQVSDASTGMDYVLRSGFRTPLLVLLATSGLLLLITCVNVASLLVARGSELRGEALVRSALGATRWQLAKDSLTESGVLLVCGTASAGLVGYWVARVLVRLYGETSVNFAISVAPTGNVVLFALGMTAISFCVFALVPAWMTAALSGASLLPHSARVTSDRGQIRRVAIVAQVALTIVLVTVGGLFVASLQQLKSAPLGVTDSLLTAQLSATPSGYQRGFSGASYYRMLLDQISAVHGVEAAALSRPPLLSRFTMAVTVGTPGAERQIEAVQLMVSDGFFSTAGVPLVAGTSFAPHGSPDDAPTLVLSRSLATMLFGPASPIGRTVRVGANPATQALTVIGIARDAVVAHPHTRQTAAVYLNYWQFENAMQAYPSLVVRLGPGARSAPAAIEQIVRRAGREYMSDVRMLAERLDVALTQERLLASLSGLFGLLGLTLALVGLYGVMAVTVSQRRAEFGVRMALGASRARMSRMVMREALILVIIGSLIGLPAAWSAHRIARGLFAVPDPVTPVVIGASVALMVLIGVVAAWIPARRAAAVDPIAMLRAGVQ